MLLRRPGQASLNRILPDVFFGFQVLIQLERKSALGKLHGPLQSNLAGSKDEVDVIWHNNKFMQQILPLSSIVQQNFNKQARNFFYLKKTFSLPRICCNKICCVSCATSMRNGQDNLGG